MNVHMVFNIFCISLHQVFQVAVPSRHVVYASDLLLLQGSQWTKVNLSISNNTNFHLNDTLKGLYHRRYVYKLMKL